MRCCDDVERPAKLLFTRSRKEDADEKEDEVDPEMMIEDGTDTPDADKEGEAGDEGGCLSRASAAGGSARPDGATAAAAAAAREEAAACSGTCIVLYVKGSAEAWSR